VFKLKIKVSSVEYSLILILLFLCAMNFYAKFFYFAFGTLIVMMLFRGKIRINYAFIFYLMLGVLMSLYNIENDIMAMLRCFAYVALYIVGFNLSLNLNRNNNLTEDIKITAQKRAYTLLVAIAGGSFVHFMLNFVSNIGKDLGRNTNDIWTGEPMSATAQSAIGCLMLGLAISMVLYRKKKYSRILGIALIFSMLSYNLVLAGRTMIIMLILVFAIGLIYLLACTPSRIERMKLIGGITIIVLLFILVYFANVGGIRDAVMESNLYSRFFEASKYELAETDRLDARINFLKNAFDYPFGGLHMREQFGYAHDLFLDAYDEYGILALILLIIILANGIKELYCFCRNDDNELVFRMSFLCVYTTILLEFCVEPIFAGMQWLFVCYCLINGCLASINRITSKVCDGDSTL